MSYAASINANTLPNISNDLNNSSIGTITNGTVFSGNYTTSINNNFKIPPTFKMEMFKSENGGFILNLITINPNTYHDMSKLFILNDLQNMGRDIQNILAAEILKS